jgi:cytochrome c556
MRWLVTVGSFAAVVSSVLAHEGATGVVRERMEEMESMAKALKAISESLKRKRDLASVKDSARSIQKDAEKMLSLFPQGTGQHPSEATAKVWENWPDFERRARALATESAKLAEMDVRDLRALKYAGASSVRRVRRLP